MYPDGVDNLDDVDPISLVGVASLVRDGRAFYVTNPHTRSTSAYDAAAWLKYLTLAENAARQTHPVTRMPLAPEEVWGCFIAVRKSAGPDADGIVVCLSHEVIGSMDSAATIRLRPRSPLFNIRLRGMQRSIRDDGSAQFEVRYLLVDSRDAQDEIHDERVLTVVCPGGCALAVM
jgi:hypothetical protein